MNDGTMDGQAQALAHIDDLPVTQRLCKESHEANKRLTMWVAGSCLAVIIAVGGFAGGLATTIASTTTRLDEHEKSQDRAAQVQATITQDFRCEVLTRFDRIEAKVDTVTNRHAP